jgi:hypothetical protein
MFIQTEDTPNPATLKFLPGCDVMGQGTLDITDSTKASASPLAESLFAVEGVKGVFLGADFITVTKDIGKDWAVMKPPVLSAIMGHFTSGRPVTNAIDLSQVVASEDTNESETVKQIREIIEVKVRPAVARDGGDITFQKFEDGIVFLNLKGSCAGCPSSSMTLKSGIESMLKHYIPEVKEVRQSI